MILVYGEPCRKYQEARLVILSFLLLVTLAKFGRYAILAAVTLQFA